MNNVEGAIKKFILENFLFTSDPGSIANDTSFLEKGIVDSTGVLELVGFLEETFEIDIEDDEVIPDNLDSINSLAGFVQRKKARLAQASNRS